MSQQVDVALHDAMVAIIESAPVAERGRFIDSAIRQRGRVWQRAELHRQHQEGAIARAERDRDLAEDWDWLEYEVCQAATG